MNIQFFHLNKNKNKKILLLNGLFSSSGYWLSHISQLKNYHLIIPNIDYVIFLKDIKKSLPILINKVHKITNIDNIISHSLGTVLAKTLEMDSNFINICPIHQISLINKSSFISDIAKRSKLDCSQIDFTINNASNLFEKMPIYDSSNSEVNLYPTDDIYFNYKIEPSKNNIFFMGDHFDISNAFQKIYTKDLIK